MLATISRWLKAKARVRRARIPATAMWPRFAAAALVYIFSADKKSIKGILTSFAQCVNSLFEVLPTLTPSSSPSLSPVSSIPTRSPIVMDAITDIEYLGCWSDGHTNPNELEYYSYYYYGAPYSGPFLRALPYLLNNSYSAMTIELCRKYALEQSFPLFGLQNAGQCFAGTNLTLAKSQGPSGNCNRHCVGNAKEICGGSVRDDSNISKLN